MSTIQNETSSISRTIQQALQDAGYGSYFSYAGPVIEALTAREKAIASSLIDYAIDNDASEEEVRTYIAETGMAVPDMVADDDEVDAVVRFADTLERIERQIERLTQFARSNGYRG